jgi:hypothetical protein
LKQNEQNPNEDRETIILVPSIEAQLASSGASPACRIRPYAITTLAERCAQTKLSQMSQCKMKLLARIGTCRFATEIYIEAKAHALGKQVVYVSGGVPLSDVPVE